MKSILINGTDFSRAVRVCRKFVAKTATSMAVEVKDMFLLEVLKNKETSEVEAWIWASDGYRATQLKVPIVSAEGAPFIAAIRNPVFTPRDGSHVTIELRTVKKQAEATVRYHEYGTAFTTPQPNAGQSVKDRLHILKTAMEKEANSEHTAQLHVNSHYLKDALEATIVANGDSRIPVFMAVGNPLDPVYMNGQNMQALVLPTRSTNS